jgi:Tfp pilus assembly protein PilO
LKNLKAELVKNQKIIIYGVITVCLLIANYSLFLKPTFASLKETIPRLTQLKRQFASDKDLIANIPRFKSQIEQMREVMASFNKKFSTKQEISELLAGLSDMAKDSDVKIVSIKPHPVVDTQSSQMASVVYQKFPISIRAVCGYHQLGAFLNRFGNDETFMRVADIKIQSDPKDPSQHMVYLLVNTYVLSEG